MCLCVLLRYSLIAPFATLDASCSMPPSYREVPLTPPFAPSGPNYEQILSIYLLIGCLNCIIPPRTHPFCSGPGPASMYGGMPSTSMTPATAQASTSTTTPGRSAKPPPPHGYPVNNVKIPPGPEPRQRSSWKVLELELEEEELEEEEEPHSDTAVDAGSSEPLLATLPKDHDDDNGSEYAASSDEDPVPAKRSRESARLRGVRAPSE